MRLKHLPPFLRRKGFWLLCFLFLMSPRALADNWKASIYEDAAPSRLVGVDKKQRIFNFYEKKSPLRLRYSYPCVTGQLQGDKRQINDLRTPEGVYFVEYKIANGLDFKEYGGIAYTLNYPNPVDKLRGKTGHGIWIHSKGFELVPTRGCVAINLKNIAEIGPHLLPGTPVVVAEELKSISGEKDGDLEKLRGLMRDWSAAWEGKSPRLFDFYDPEAYSRATENFDLFKKNKERLFKILSFIKIYNREIHALEGPGYWVTWSEQLYTASNLSTEGIRRLYWQKDDKGDFRIVGMEWTPRDMGMKAEAREGRLIAQAPSVTASDASSEAPAMPRLDMPEKPEAVEAAPEAAPAPVKTEGGSGGVMDKVSASIAALAENLRGIGEPLVPKSLPKLKLPDEIEWGKGRPLTSPEPSLEAPSEPAAEAIPSHSAPAGTEPAEEKPVEAKPAEFPAARTEEARPADPRPEQAKPAQDKPAQAATQTPAQAAPDKPAQMPPEEKPAEAAPAEAQPVQTARKPLKPARPSNPDEDIQELKNSVSGWLEAYKAKNRSVSAYYDQKNYNRMSVYGVPASPAYNKILQGMQRDFSQPWMELLARPSDLELHGPVAKSRTDLMIIGPHGMRQGVQTLWWHKDDEGKYRIVGSEFRPHSLGLDANYLENISADVARMVEDWRQAWEAGSIDKYMGHYTKDAVQQGRAGLGLIRRQKEDLWQRKKPAHVQLAGMRLALDNRGVRADMSQTYSDSTGASDRGIKTLFLRYDGGSWKIQREDWTNLHPAPAPKPPAKP